MRRRSWLTALVLGPLMGADSRAEAVERVIDVASGQPLDRAAVLQRMREADFVLLGEVHDNALHHARRAELLSALPAGPVVAEHLPRGAPLALPAAPAPELLAALQAAGFEAGNWRWPLHQPLFAALARAGHALRGGNLTREQARRLAREGEAALPEDLAPLLGAAPLPASALAALTQDLQQGHCNQLPAQRMPGMVAAQRGRDAAMAQALLAARAQSRGVAVLLAGNGHVRRDYGVPVLLAAQPGAGRVLSIGFVEPGAEPASALPYDIAWQTPAAPRPDPCEALRPKA